MTTTSITLPGAPRPIRSPGEYAAVIRRVAPWTRDVDGRLLAVGFNFISPRAFACGEHATVAYHEESADFPPATPLGPGGPIEADCYPERRGLRPPVRLDLDDWLDYWESGQPRPDRVGSTYNADPDHAFRAYRLGAPAWVGSLARIIGECGRSGRARAEALVRLGRRLGVDRGRGRRAFSVLAHVGRARDLRRLSRLSSACLRAVAGAVDGLGRRPSWADVESAILDWHALQVERPFYEAARIPAWSWIQVWRSPLLRRLAQELASGQSIRDAIRAASRPIDDWKEVFGRLPMTVITPAPMREHIAAIYAGRESLDPLTTLALDIHAEDRLWVVLRPEVMGERALRLAACDFAERALPIYEARHPGDTRPRRAIETSRRYARGEATVEELHDAFAAARAAAWAAGWDADRDAADAAADAAAKDVAWADAFAAAFTTKTTYMDAVLDAVLDAARAASETTARAAFAAARAAAWAVVKDAAKDAADAAAWGASETTARTAEREAQLAIVRGYLERPLAGDGACTGGPQRR